METIGAFEAKTKLASLLDRVARGERFTISRHGVPVAELVPVNVAIDRGRLSRAIQELKEFRKGRSLVGLSVRDMIDDGRRY